MAVASVFVLTGCSDDPKPVGRAAGLAPKQSATEVDADTAHDRALRRARRTRSAQRNVLRVVEGYYASLDNNDLDTAWARLSPKVQSDFNGYGAWRDGFESTVSQTPTSVRIVSLRRSVATVFVRFKATDLDVCGVEVRQRFEGTWVLARENGRWTATSVEMSRVAGSSPTTDFADCESSSDGEYVHEDAGGDCDPNYAGACIPDVSYDLDCGEVAGSDFTVVGDDVHGFDRDGDGSACES